MQTFAKPDKLVSKTLIDLLFKKGSKSLYTPMLKLIFRTIDEKKVKEMTIDPREHSQRQVLITVPKRYFKRAVKRNRVKRQIREAYRTSNFLPDVPDNHRLIMVFIWQQDVLYPSQEVAKCVDTLLKRMRKSL